MKNPGLAGRSSASHARSTVVLLLTTMTAVALADRTRAGEPDAVPLEFNIPAQSVPDALGEFARQAQAQLFFISDGFEQVEANALVGTYSAQKALDLLLEGTGLAGRYSADSGIKVTPVPASGGALDSASRFLRKPSGSSGGQNPDDSASPADALPGQEESAGYPEERAARAVIEEIVVTGTHIRGVQTVGASVITFDREQLDQTGFETVEEFFENLPQNLDELSSDGSLATGVSRTAGTNNQGASSISLRGLGPGSTLVLLNGKRLPASVFGLAVDVSAIPFSMIERIEVVTSGLSAIYGSDAVAGVVNIVTRKDFDGAETRISYGEASAGAGQFEFSQTFGRELDGGGFTLGYTYRDEQPLDVTDTGVVIAPSIVGATPLPGLFDLRHASEQHAGLLAGRLALGDGAELYADAHVSLDENTREIAFELVGIEIGEISITDSDQYSASAGLLLDLGANWRLDLSALTGEVENSRGATTLVLPAGSITTLDVPLQRERNDEAELTSISAVADGPIG
ncbi:MAG TPA: TonB-dependent receptor, partial [Woeseiaceae bacterium]|nr:TonB-dependent receptor [Woeseiaceae bacterium]